jgi:hypothetical protein
MCLRRPSASRMNWDEASQTGPRTISPFTMTPIVLRCTFPRPPKHAQTACNSHLIRLTPIARLLVETIAQDLFHSNVLSLLNPVSNQRLPSILVETLLQFISRCCAQLRRIDPPSVARLKTSDRLGPELVSITSEFFDPYGSAAYWPETTAPVSSFKYAS